MEKKLKNQILDWAVLILLVLSLYIVGMYALKDHNCMNMGGVASQEYGCIIPRENLSAIECSICAIECREIEREANKIKWNS